MSNGERNVLSFVASMVAFEARLGNKPDIPIIGEVFDCLDGTNLLAAQYYLSQMMAKAKKRGRTVTTAIMTHLGRVTIYGTVR